MGDGNATRRHDAMAQAEHKVLIAEDELNVATAMGTNEDCERAAQEWQAAQSMVHRLALQAE